MALEDLNCLFDAYKSGKDFTYDDLRANPDLTRHIQTRLQQFRLLEDIDGIFGVLSTEALKNYAKLRGFEEGKYLLPNFLIEDLIESDPSTFIKGFKFKNTVPNCNGLVQYYLLNGWDLEIKSGEINICALTGVNRRGTLNNDARFKYNDRIIVFTFDDENGLKTPRILENFLGTAQPGRHFWFKPMNPKGCAVLKQDVLFKSWLIGRHRNYPALVQTGGAVTVLRGSGEKEDTGYFGINIHSVGVGKDFNFQDEIGRYSAGCTVLASRKEFDKEFMPLVYNSSQCKNKKVFGFISIEGKKYRRTIPYLKNFCF